MKKYKPKNPNDAVNCLLGYFDDEIKNKPVETLVHDVGNAVTNDWNLSEPFTPLRRWFWEKDVTSPRIVILIIFNMYHEVANGRSVDINKLIKKYNRRSRSAPILLNILVALGNMFFAGILGIFIFGVVGRYCFGMESAFANKVGVIFYPAVVLIFILFKWRSYFAK